MYTLSTVNQVNQVVAREVIKYHQQGFCVKETGTYKQNLLLIFNSEYLKSIIEKTLPDQVSC